jgi:hypothetical protein
MGKEIRSTYSHFSLHNDFDGEPGHADIRQDPDRQNHHT